MSKGFTIEKEKRAERDGVTTAPDQFGVTVGDAGGWKPQPPTFQFIYGWAEARIKIPKGQVLWPAWWLLPSDMTWPPEIDILEVIGTKPGAAELHYHYGKDPNHPQLGGPKPMGVALSADFHVYAVDWQADHIDWYTDGKKLLSFTDRAQIYSKPMYPLLNLAVGGDLPKAPDASTKFPAEMIIDWIRVYQGP